MKADLHHRNVFARYDAIIVLTNFRYLNRKRTDGDNLIFKRRLERLDTMFGHHLVFATYDNLPYYRHGSLRMIGVRCLAADRY